MLKNRKKINLAQIAEECGLSIATISRVLNNKDSVSKKTREKVLKILQDHNISMPKKSPALTSRHITILFHNRDILGLHHHGYELVIKKVETFLSKEGYSIILVKLGEDNTLPEIVRNGGTKGVILLGNSISEIIHISLFTQGIPFVCIDKETYSQRYFSVNTDNFNGIRKAVEYLVELGHKKIAFISGSLKSPKFQERYNAFKQEVENSNIALIKRYVKIKSDNEDEQDFSIRSIEEILEQDPLPSAMILSSNVFAKGIIQVLTRNNIRIPEDISIIGFDDGVVTQYPEMVSLIRPDWGNKGEIAALILSQQIKGINIHPYRAIVNNNLVVNNTCARYNKKGIRRNIVSPMVYWTEPGTLHEHEKSIVAIWNKNNSKSIITFNPVPKGMETEEVIKSSIVKGTSPDLYQGIEAFFANYLARDGVLVPLDTMEGFSTIVKKRKIEKFLDKIRAADGHIYILPQHWTPILGIYNRSLLKEAGFDNAPKTFNDFERFAEHLKKIENRIPADFILSPDWWIVSRYCHAFYMAMMGEKGLSSDVVNIDTPENRAFLEFLSDAVKKGFISSDKDKYDFIKKGNVGYKLLRHPHDLVDINKINPKLSLVFSPLPIPDFVEYPSSPWTEASIKGASIFKSSKNIDKAWNFIMWYYLTEENDLNLLRVISHIPCRGDLNENPIFSEYFNQYPHIKELSSFVERSGTIIHPDKIEIFSIIAEKLWKPLIFGDINDIDKLFNETTKELSDL